MAAVNPNPHKTGYHFLPNRCVTCTFPMPLDAATTIDALCEVGFAESDIQLFTGDEGAKQLDVDANKQSLPTKLLQSLTKALADDAGYLERAARVLREGGTLFSVSITDEEKDDYDQAVERATAVLKSHGGEDVQHWGDWTTEKL